MYIGAALVRAPLLERDRVRLGEEFPAAADFLVSASLRHEALSLIGTRPEHRTLWQSERLAELLGCPACHDPWFIEELDQAQERWR